MAGRMISPSLNHVFVIMHGVLWSSKEHLACVPVPRPRVGLGHGAVNVQSAVERSLGSAYMWLARVDALIGGNDVVSVTLATIRGQLKVIV